MVMGQTLCGWSMEGLQASAEPGFGLILGKPCEVAVELLPDGLGLRLSDHVLQWESLACPPVAGFLVGLIFIVRLVWFVRSPLLGRHEAQLTKALAAQMEEKCHLIDKNSAAREECAGIQSSLDDGRRETASLNVPSLADTYRKVTTTYWILRQEITSVVHQLKEERSKRSMQEEEISRQRCSRCSSPWERW